MTVFVMARNNHEYTIARSLYPETLAGAQYLDEPKKLRGTKNATVYKYGALYEHPNYRVIQEIMATQKAVERYI